MRKSNVVDGLSMQQVARKDKEKTAKSGSQHTLPTKSVNETKYCKDCVAYTRPTCNEEASTFVQRKHTCKKWVISKKASSLVPKKKAEKKSKKETDSANEA